MDVFDKFIHQEFIKQELEFSELYRYLDRYRNTGYDVHSQIREKRNTNVKLNSTLWIFWKQGLENSPKLIQKCYESVCRNAPGDFKVILLNDKTLDEYVDLPDYIWDKYEKGYITTTHLSDIIRLELLCTYGGCWIDATVFCSDRIPGYMLKGDMFVFKLPSILSDPVVKLSSWWMYADNSNRLSHQTRQMLYEYWRQESDIRNYFLLHIIMSKLIDEDSNNRYTFQRIPYFNSGNAHILQGKLGMEYDEKEWQIMKSISCVHKLTYKNRCLQGDIYNYYSALLADDLS